MMEYLRQTRAELSHVTWPTRNQTIVYTLIVIVVAVAISATLGLFDLFFSWLLKLILN